MNTNSVGATFDTSKQRLAQDLRAVIADTEDLLRATADQAGEKMASMRQRAQANLAQAKVRLVEAEQALVDRTKVAAQATDDYVHENPWQSVGIAAAVGVLVGMLIGRGR
ncbi:YqjD family protein [Ferrigenium sp. UT5]|uniref:DUF883 family protein n=1 Tax=Ferrigenium sp. UT5 TaxID=3242105 RepID=UPI0035537B36